ncbi:MAG: DUF6142 family protein [Lachnoclostridium sp.]|jgi:hypothetical protein|nr:DUF6142 family protein [Lachnoclostridium sp.]
MAFFIAKKIQFTDKVHPLRGIVSTIIGILSLLFMLGLFIGAGNAKGLGGEIYGYLGTFNVIAAVTGFIMGLLCFRMEDIFIRFPIIGTVLNGIVSFVLIALYILGTNR